MLKQVVNIPGLEYLECHAAVALATLWLLSSGT